MTDVVPPADASTSGEGPLESGATTVELLVDGHAILPALLADLMAARRTIHVAMFLWFDDPVGAEIADALIAKARAGIRVRVLLNIEKTALGDPFSTGENEMMKHDPSIAHDTTDVKPLCKRMRDAGIEVHDTNIDYALPVTGLSPRLTSIASQIHGTIDLDALHVDHRKIVVVDGRVAYCGGANIGAQYMHHAPFDPSKDAHEEARERLAAGLKEPWWKWHDSLTRFEGPIAAVLDEHFRDRFLLDGGADFLVARPEGADLSRLGPHCHLVRAATAFSNEPNDRPNGVRELYLRLIREAERSIFIENPYLYHPDLTLALCEAKERKPALRVVLVMPALTWNDNAFGYDAQQFAYAGYLERGIEVYEYQQHFNHLKIAVFDERFSIHGSTNGNYRSLDDDKDFELVVLVDDEPLALDVLARVRDVDVAHARRFTLADLDGSLAAFRVKHRDPRTLLLTSRRVL